jgi:hypothetical protein
MFKTLFFVLAAAAVVPSCSGADACVYDGKNMLSWKRLVPFYEFGTLLVTSIVSSIRRSARYVYVY